MCSKNYDASKNPEKTILLFVIKKSLSPTCFFIGPPSKLVPLSWPGIISCSLSLFCALLNLIRVVPFVSEHGNEPQEEVWMKSHNATIFYDLILQFTLCIFKDVYEHPLLVERPQGLAKIMINYSYKQHKGKNKK